MQFFGQYCHFYRTKLIQFYQNIDKQYGIFGNIATFPLY